MLTGIGRILAGLSIRPDPITAPELAGHQQDAVAAEISRGSTTNELPAAGYQPPSVTEHTTNILNRR